MSDEKEERDVTVKDLIEVLLQFPLSATVAVHGDYGYDATLSVTVSTDENKWAFADILDNHKLCQSLPIDLMKAKAERENAGREWQ